jgi:GDP-4-dehydro-6-deoxy-D-mannose reductase
MRALVTGAGGFVGRHLVAHLRESGMDVLTAGTKAVTGHHSGHHYCYKDFTSVGEQEALLRSFQPQQIYHLAGVASSLDVAMFYRVNSAFAAALLEAIERTVKAEAITLLLGTAAEYGSAGAGEMPLRESRLSSPETHYGISKLAQTMMAQAAARRGMRVVLPRAFNIVGPHMPGHTALGDFARQVVAVENGDRAPVLSVGNLATYRDFVDVRDVTVIFKQMMTVQACLGRVINICSGQPKLMEEVVDELVAGSNRSIRIEVDKTRYKVIDVPTSYGSTDLLHELLGCSLSVHWTSLCADMLKIARVAAVSDSAAMH